MRPRHLPIPVFVLVLVLVSVLTSCRFLAPKIYDPSQVAFDASYNPLYEGQFYPSLVMAMSHSVQNAQPSNADSRLFSVSVTAPTNNAVLRVTIDSSRLNYVTIFQEELPRRGERYTFYPSIKWKFDKLYALRQRGTTDLTFTCFINDEEVDVRDVRINYHSVGDCLLSIRDTAGNLNDFRWMIAAYVNEEHPYIDSILTDILQAGLVTKIDGYQSSREQVVKQVEAIWYYALQRGIAYSSISCTANPTKNSNVQHIRFFDEVHNSRQANCVDACVFFASIMRKIGLKPVIFIDPCHAYIGYYTDKNRKRLNLLETTITAWVNFPALDRAYRPDAEGADRLPMEQYNRVSKYLNTVQRRQWEAGTLSLEGLKQAVAHSLFIKASNQNIETHAQNRAHYADPDNIQYQQLDIEQLRKFVSPVTE